MIELPLAFAIGVALGVVTGMPLGVVNVAVVETAASRGARAAGGIGVGGALADLCHASLAFGGVGRAIVARPGLTAAMHAVAGGVLCVYAAVLWRRRPPAGGASTDDAAAARRGFGRGVVTGVALTLPNPAALGAWIAVAAALAPPTISAGLAAAVGVGVGSAAWFVALAVVSARGAGTRALTRRTFSRGVAVVLGALGVAAIVRAIV